MCVLCLGGPVPAAQPQPRAAARRPRPRRGARTRESPTAAAPRAMKWGRGVCLRNVSAEGGPRGTKIDAKQHEVERREGVECW